MFDWSVNLGNALTIVSFIGGGIIFVVTIRGRVDALTGRITFVEQELRKMVEVLIMQGRHDERMAAMDARIQSQGQRLDTLTNRINRVLNHVEGEDK
jgi:hypothetical protein